MGGVKAGDGDSGRGKGRWCDSGRWWYNEVTIVGRW